MFALVLAAAAISSEPDIGRYFPVDDEDRVIVTDAIKRWSLKDGGARQAMRGRIPIVFHLPEQRCVELYLLPPAVGGTPIYCYKVSSDRLVRAVDRVE